MAIRTETVYVASSGSQSRLQLLTSEPQSTARSTGAQSQRVVLLVERQVAALGRRFGSASGMRRARAAAQMRDLGRRREQHLAAAPPDGVAEVDVLGVEEERSSSRPAASASARRTSRQAPLTQSTNCSRARFAPRSTSGVPPLLPRTRSSGEIIRPNDSSGTPVAIHQPRARDRRAGRRPQPRDAACRSRPAARGCRCSAAAAGRRALARIPALFAAAKPGVAPHRDHAHAGNPLAPPRRCRRSRRCRRRRSRAARRAAPSSSDSRHAAGPRAR